VLGLITNPPFDQGGKLATAFIEVGLKRMGNPVLLALLLSCDFDSAKTRARYFGARRSNFTQRFTTI
jgi:hypothetical protein